VSESEGHESESSEGHAEDPNMARIEELKKKYEGGEELTDEESEFLDKMAEDEKYPVHAEPDET
jgi:hypothetical protein